MSHFNKINNTCNVNKINTLANRNVWKTNTVNHGKIIEISGCSALNEYGQAFVWGDNYYGQLGNNFYDLGGYVSSPIAVCLPINKYYNSAMTNTAFSVALDNEGQAWAWGFNTSYQLGINAAIASVISPVQVCMGGRTFCQIETGSALAIALDQNGQGWGWGTNTIGQLGTNSVTVASSPVAVCMGGRTFCQISTLSEFTLALDQNGQCWAWGGNTSGELGNNSATASFISPIAVCMGGRTFCQISAGGFSLALDQNGQCWAWGLNTSGQLGGNSATASFISPVGICMGGRTFCRISAGVSSLAMDQNGQAFAWGANTMGQLGNYTLTGVSSPVAVCMGGRTFCQISAGSFGAMVIDKYNQVWAWGNNLYSQTGNMQKGSTFGVAQPTIPYSSPVAVCMGGRTFCQIAAKINFIISLDKNGQAWAWGQNTTSGNLGNNNNTAANYSSPIAVCMGGRTFCKIATDASFHSLSLDSAGQAWAWGKNTVGQLGNYTTTDYSSPIAVCMGGRTFCQIQAGTTFSLALDNNGQLFSWGLNTSNQLGIYEGYFSSPIAVCMGGRNITTMGLGYQHNMAIDNGGLAWSWGINTYGVLGNNDTGYIQQRSPIAVCMGGRTFCTIEGTISYNSCAIDNGGMAWSWGYNQYGELGINSVTSSISPVAVCMGGRTFCKIAGGQQNIVALANTGLVFAWGYNNYGYLGDNSVTSRRSPVDVCMGGRTFCEITGGAYTTYALTSAGLAFAWGYNQYGYLGDNSVTSRRSPVSVCTAGRTFCQISAGTYHVLALDNAGMAFAWGLNTSGQLGNNSATASFRSPIAVCMGGRTFCQIVAANGISLALDNAGMAFAWGRGSFGDLGNMTLGQVSSPIAVCMGGRTFCKIFGINRTIFAIDNSGNPYVWGDNLYGAGVELLINSVSSPVAVCMNGRTFCKIAVGTTNCVALQSDGQAFAWGSYLASEIGDNSVTCRIALTAVCMGGRTFCEISSGNRYIVAVSNTGELWTWGSNAYTLGTNAATLSMSSPIAVCVGGRTFCKISCENQMSYALDKQYGVWAWGKNDTGEIGSNSIAIASVSSPVAVCV